MKKLALVMLAAVVVVTSLASCGGPFMLSRGWSDVVNEGYTETPWLWGNVIAYAVTSIVHGVAYWVDGIVNIYYFWAKDAQPFGTGQGTTYVHKNVAPKKK